MINFLAHWSTYSIIFFRKGTLTVCVLKPCTLEIVFLLLFHMKANVSRARILGTQYLLLEIASKKEKGNLHSKLKLFTAVIMWTVLHCFLPVFVFFFYFIIFILFLLLCIDLIYPTHIFTPTFNMKLNLFT